jgi:hypothetical protein
MIVLTCSGFALLAALTAFALKKPEREKQWKIAVVSEEGCIVRHKTRGPRAGGGPVQYHEIAISQHRGCQEGEIVILVELTEDFSYLCQLFGNPAYCRLRIALAWNEKGVLEVVNNSGHPVRGVFVQEQVYSEFGFQQYVGPRGIAWDSLNIQNVSTKTVSLRLRAASCNDDAEKEEITISCKLRTIGGSGGRNGVRRSGEKRQ